MTPCARRVAAGGDGLRLGASHVRVPGERGRGRRHRAPWSDRLGSGVRRIARCRGARARSAGLFRWRRRAARPASAHERGAEPRAGRTAGQRAAVGTISEERTDDRSVLAARGRTRHQNLVGGRCAITPAYPRIDRLHERGQPARQARRGRGRAAGPLGAQHMRSGYMPDACCSQQQHGWSGRGCR